MNNVLIHCHSSYLPQVKKLGLSYTNSNGEIDVIVKDIPYEVENDYYQDPDEQLCEHYGIDYTFVNCIEAA